MLVRSSQREGSEESTAMDMAQACLPSPPKQRQREIKSEYSPVSFET